MLPSFVKVDNLTWVECVHQCKRALPVPSTQDYRPNVPLVDTEMVVSQGGPVSLC